MAGNPQDVTVYNEDGTLGVTIKTDLLGDIRFFVDARVTDSTVAVTRLKPRFHHSDTPIVLNDITETTLLDIDFDGAIDGISLMYEIKETETIIIIDGVEIFRISNEDLEDGNKFDLSFSSTAAAFPVQVSNSGKHLTVKWDNGPAGVFSNLTIKAISTKDTSNNLRGIVVMYRVKP